MYLLSTIFVPSSVSPDSFTDIMFVRSTDGGETWSDPIRVNDDPEGNGAWQWFGMMSVGPNGRIDESWRRWPRSTAQLTQWARTRDC